MSIRENLEAIRAEIDAAARETGRTGADITLVGASKMNDAAACQEAIAAGIDALGENRVQELTAKLAQNPQVRSVVSKTMEEWLLPAQLYIQNKFREAFDAVEDQLPEHTVLEPEGNKSSFTVTFPSWKERDDAHAVLANGGVRFRSGKALVPFRITGNIDWGVPVPEVDGVNDVTCWCWPESLWAPISYTRTVLARDAKAAGVTEGVAAQDAAPRPPTSTARSTGATGGALTTLRSTSSSARTTSTSTASRRPPCGRPWVGTLRRAPSAPATTCSTWAKRQARPRRRLPRRQTTCSTTTPASRCARIGCRSACPRSR